MPAPTAPEPHDPPEPSDAAAQRSAIDRGEAGVDDRRSPDLSSVPAFLRGRTPDAGAQATRTVGPRAIASPVPDVASLPMLGIAPRRLVLIGLSIVLVWMVASFGRQVAEASAASARANDLRAATTAITTEIDALQRELQTIQDQRFIEQAARAYRLGTPNEIPFALEADAPELPADAPGSASVRIGAVATPSTPLESWLDVLFGPGD